MPEHVEKQKCAQCGVDSPLWDFAVVWRRGTPYPHTVCLSCEGLKWDKGHHEREPCYCLQTGPIVERTTNIYDGVSPVVRRRFLLAMRYEDDDDIPKRKWWRLYDRSANEWVSGNLGYSLAEAVPAAEHIIRDLHEGGH